MDMDRLPVAPADRGFIVDMLDRAVAAEAARNWRDAQCFWAYLADVTTAHRDANDTAANIEETQAAMAARGHTCVGRGIAGLFECEQCVVEWSAAHGG
jgi:hypothetical protein